MTSQCRDSNIDVWRSLFSWHAVAVVANGAPAVVSKITPPVAAAAAAAT
jgi:hypothetical protein